MFTTIFPPAIGGPATQCFNLCQALNQKGITPIVVTYGDKFSKTLPNGYPVRTFRRYYNLGPLDRLLRWAIFPFYIAYVLKKEKADILHCHSANMLSFVAAAIAGLFGIPRVLKFAGDWVWETLSTKGVRAKDFKEIYSQSFYSRLLTFIEKIGLRLFNVIWVVSEFRKENINYLIGEAVPIVVMPNSLILKNKIAPEKPKKEKITIVSANRFIPHKRIPYLVEAFAEAANSDAELVIIGGGDSRETEKVKAKIKELGVEKSVRLTGILSKEAIEKEFSAADFYVSTSLEEGFPNVFIEAMNSGLPVIATDLGGSKELIIDGKTGFMALPEDKEGLIVKMRLLIQNTALRQQFAKAAFEHSLDFDLEKRIGEFIKMYESLR